MMIMAIAFFPSPSPSSLHHHLRYPISQCGSFPGITPILQVLRAIFADPTDTSTRVWVLDANKSEADILCQPELSALLADHGSAGTGRMRLHHVLSLAPASEVEEEDGVRTWACGTYSRGRINDELLRAHLPSPPPLPASADCADDEDDTLILVCGPRSMVDETVKPGLARCGWDVGRCVVVF